MMSAVRRIVEAFGSQQAADPVRGEMFMQELLTEWKGGSSDLAAEFVWTSAQKYELPDGKEFEFCYIFSEALREDRNLTARACAILASGLKANLVTARKSGVSSSDEVAFPTNGECWRGGGFNEDHRGWFDTMVGKQYRVPAFLATSLNETVITKFMQRAEDAGFSVVRWHILLDKRGDPAGDNDPRHKCKHVNLLRATHCEGEAEFLFQAFSTFTVKKVEWSSSLPATVDEPHNITLEAAVDNTKTPEDLPLAPWC